MIDEKYGGIITNINTLPIGTKFYVHNGHWNGIIVEKNNCKLVKCYETNGKFVHTCVLNDDYNYELSISIL